MKLQSIYIFLTILSTINQIIHAQDDQIQKQFLDSHNVARSQVGVAPLYWNNTLYLFAETFVNKIKATCDDTLSSGNPYGENTAGGYGAFSTEEAVGQWVGEKSNSCRNGSSCRHYTQVVWKNSLGLGCASVLCGAGWPFVVCEYFPKGNIEGESPY